MTKNYNRITRGVMFNIWLFNLHNKKSSGKINGVFSLQKKKRTSLHLSVVPEKFSDVLTTQTERVPSSFPFFNRSFDKKKLKSLFSWYFANCGEAATFSLVEKLQKFGFSYAMKAGISLGVDDLKVPLKKGEFLTEAVELLANTKASVNSGNVTALEEFQQFVDTWHRTSENLKISVVQNFSQSSLVVLKQANLDVSSLSVNVSNLQSGINQNTTNASFLKKVKFSKKEGSFSSSAVHTLPLFTCRGKDNILSPQNFSKELRDQVQNVFQTELKSGNDQNHRKQQLFSRSSNNILNPVYMMAFSGARGNLSQVRQLVGMRGLMADPQGQLVEFPIQSNFREGLTVTEYMISCYGARKGIVDTALRTAAAGYLTRRLVDVSHHQIVRFVTCGTKSGIFLFAEHNKKNQIKNTVLPSAWKSSPSKNQSHFNSSRSTPASDKKKDDKKDPLLFCVGRVLAREIPGVAFRNQEIDISLATSSILKNIYEKSGFFIRSPLTCRAETGVCQLCYGWSVSANRLVGLGEAVGIIAAQSIGEPGTQLTMRTFHTGGVFSGDIMEECRAKHAGIVYFQTFYLGLLVRTAGGAIAFCLKTPAILQIKGEKEITSYNLSANTLLFVRQGEKVLLDSLLAQIPNLPTIEESAGESTKTIVSDLSGEVRQKPTINPQLASLRILAGQQCTQFYMFNYQQTHAVNDFSSVNSLANQFKHYNNKKLVSFVWDKLVQQFESPAANNYQSRTQVHDLEQLNNEKLKTFTAWSSTKKFTKLITSTGLASYRSTKKTEGLVQMIWGAHRLGKNKIFTINLNGATAQVIVSTFSSPFSQVKLKKQILKTKNKHENQNLRCHLNWTTESVAALSRTHRCQLVTTQLLAKLRVFVACKIQSNRVLITSSLKRTNTSHLTKKQLLPLLPLTTKHSKQASAKNLEFFRNSNATPKLLAPQFDYPAKKKLKDFFVYCKRKKKLQMFTLSSEKLFLLKIDSLPMAIKKQNFLLSYLSSKQFFSPKQFSQNSSQLLNKQSHNNAIQGIATLSFWPKAYRFNIVDYGFLLWTLQDLIFFRGFYTKTKELYSQVQISINKNWQDNCSKLLRKVNVKKKSLGPVSLDYVSFLDQSQNGTIIERFPTLLLTLYSRFNIENSLKKFENYNLVTRPQVSSKNLLNFNHNFSKNLNPKIKFQDSGEICPLQGNTNLTKFQNSYRSLQKITNLNSGLLMHYNRVSYKLPLCLCSTNSLTSLHQRANLLSKKEQLSLLRSKLPLFNSTPLNNKQKTYNSSFVSLANIRVCPGVPQIGTFLNTGDEIKNETATAYCGQIIEKSPIGLTLRLTQNILYSNLRNRPAKINKNVKNGYWISKGAPLVTLPYISNVTGDIVAGIPKIEQLFEARGETLDETIDKIWDTYKISIVPRSKAVRECFKEIGLFVVAAIQTVYFSQGVNIADKHLEVIIRQMTRRAIIVDPGDTEFLPDEFVDINTIECVNWATYGENATYRPRLIGITKASLTSNSFLSSASFQQTARVLERETILEKTDPLLGLKERVMMGALINAGTGELKTTVQISDQNKVTSSTKLVKRLNFFSRQQVQGTQQKS